MKNVAPASSLLLKLSHKECSPFIIFYWKVLTLALLQLIVFVGMCQSLFSMEYSAIEKYLERTWTSSAYNLHPPCWLVIEFSLFLVECYVECSIECSMFLVECSAGHHLPLVRTKGVPTLAAAAGALESKENKNFYFYLFSGGQM